jgi:hypothetical protein
VSGLRSYRVMFCCCLPAACRQVGVLQTAQGAVRPAVAACPYLTQVAPAGPAECGVVLEGVAR